MGLHRLTINRRAFEYIRKGIKTIEGRLKKGYFISNPIVSGDIIIFENSNEQLTTNVVKIHEYININECVNSISINSLSPYFDSSLEIIKHYNKFYSKKQLNELPFLAIDLICLSKITLNNA